MYKGSITDVKGIAVGHAQNLEARTGCTAILCPENTRGGVAVRGGAPGTRETDLLDPQNTVDQVDAVMLCGGSAFGLDAAGGAMAYLEAEKRGVKVGAMTVPIVPAAVLFDLGVGEGKVRPDYAMGLEACQNASEIEPPQGRFGAGTGATVGKLMGQASSMDGGIGTASVRLPGGVVVGAIVAVNAVGDVVDYKTGEILAGVRLPGGKMPGAQTLMTSPGELIFPPHGANTTIGAVATNAQLTKAQANRLAQVSHDGLAWAIRPAHLPMDGDTLFALSCGTKKIEFALVCAAAMEAVARAVNNAILSQR